MLEAQVELNEASEVVRQQLQQAKVAAEVTAEKYKVEEQTWTVTQEEWNAASAARAQADLINQSLVGNLEHELQQQQLKYALYERESMENEAMKRRTLVTAIREECEAQFVRAKAIQDDRLVQEPLF